MHYYKFNIADWALHTAHLTLVEEAVYFRLINHYYDSEQPIPLETQSVMRRLRVATESDIVSAILGEFFVKTDKGFLHNRCEELLKEYRKTVSKNRKNAMKGGRPRKNAGSSETQSVTSGIPEVSQEKPKGIPNQELLTNNHKPLTTIKDNPTSDLVNQVFDHWKKRLNHPRSALDNPRKTKIKNALRNYSVDQLIEAIDGCAKSPYHMGQNDNGKVYDSIDLIFRNADKIDDFIKTNQMPIGGFNENNGRPTSPRPDNSAAGRVRQNGAKRKAENAKALAEIQRNDRPMADDGQPIRPQVGQLIR